MQLLFHFCSVKMPFVDVEFFLLIKQNKKQNKTKFQGPNINGKVVFGQCITTITVNYFLCDVLLIHKLKSNFFKLRIKNH